MRGIDVGECPCVSGVVEVLDRVGTEKVEGLLTGESVPELLEPDRRVTVSLRPQQRDHLAEGEDAAVAAAGRPDDRSDRGREAMGIRPAVDHETREGLLRVERVVATARAQLR